MSEAIPNRRKAIQPRLIPGDVDSLVVAQANLLATSIQDMTLLERRILMLALAVLSRSDTELPFVRIYSSDIRRAFGLSHNSLNRELDEATDKLMGRYVQFVRSRHGSTSKISWINAIHFTTGKDSEVGTAYIDVQLHEQMSRYVLQLTGNFFRVPFAVLAKFRSLYGMRLCEMLTADSFGGSKSRVYFDLKELKQILDCDTKSYRNFSNFRQRVLEPAQAENAEVGYLGFEYEPVKRGRKVVGLWFTVAIRAQDSDEGELDVRLQEDDIRRMTLENDLRESGFAENPRPYIDRLGVDAVERIYRECRQLRQQSLGSASEIRNFGGFLHARLKRALEDPEVLAPVLDDDGYAHATSQDIYAVAEVLVQELFTAQTEYAMRSYRELPDEQREEVRRRALQIDPWTAEHIRREGEDGGAFRTAVKRALEDAGLGYPAVLSSVDAFVSEERLAPYRPNVRAKILRAARESE